MNAIDNYTHNVLKNQLLKHVRIKAVKKVINDINNRLRSLISRWDDEEFREVILLLGKEEALFYEPNDVDLKIKSMVVVCMRNSLFEDLQSNEMSFESLGVKNAISRELVIKEYTESAIRYFSEINIEVLAKETSPGELDVFGHIPSAYPVAWNAMKRLSQLKEGEEVDFEPMETTPQLLESIAERPMIVSRKLKFNAETQSGVSPIIDSGLYTLLEGNERIFVDSFKALTRNTDKFFKVLEYVLRSDELLATNNVLIFNGVVSSRKGWLRPMHTDPDFFKNLMNENGLHGVHKEIIENDVLEKAQ